MAKEQGQQTTLLELYKLQIQSANDACNRSVMVNRYYASILSGIGLALVALLSIDIDTLPFEWVMLVAGVLGATVSFAWCYSAHSHILNICSICEVLKYLESELEYQFFQRESQPSNYQLAVPVIFYSVSHKYFNDMRMQARSTKPK